MSEIRENYRKLQKELGVHPEFATGIPNEATRKLFEERTEEALQDYRASQQAEQPSSPSLPQIVIGSDHWIVGVKRMPLPPRGNLVPLCTVLHFTAGASAESSVEAMSERGVSAHVVIDRDGTIIQCVPFNRIAYHAGSSMWKDPVTLKIYDGLNGHSIGIEIANAGDDHIPWVENRPGYKSIQAKHRNGGSIETWEVFYDPQMASVRALTKVLWDKYGLHDVTGHDCIAPSRKNDPGPAFPMELVRADVGLKGLPEVFR